MDTNENNEFNANKTYKEVTYSTKWEENRPKEYFEYRENWIKFPQEKKVPNFPLHLDIETTNVCNLKCPMCPRTVMLDKKEFSAQGYMTRDEYKMIIDQAVKYGVKSIKLNYLGEPLLHKDVVWQVEYAKQQGVLDVMMNSNGSLLTPEISEGLLKAGLDKLFISFDSISPDIYEVQRKGTNLGTVINNVYNFAQLRNRSYPDTHIRLSMVMYETPEYMAQFEGLKTMWKNLVDAVGYGFYIEHDANSQEFPKVEGFHCEQLFQRMFLKYNGNVTVCCFDEKDEITVGNWREEDLKNIWVNEKYREMRDTHISGNYCDISLCRRCYLPVAD